MGMKTRSGGTRGKALLEKRIGELESEVFVLGERNAGLEVKLQEGREDLEDLIKVNDNQRERLTEASLLRTHINELKEKINSLEQDEA